MTTNEPPKVGGLLLAAGGSSRFGQPKQLVEYKGLSLIRRAADALAGSECEPIVVVLGAETERSTKPIADLPIQVIVNNDWQAGMSSSIRAGVNELREIEPCLDAIVITLCDQPLISAADIDRLVKKYLATRASIVAAAYGGVLGVPALFSDEWFEGLLQLKGDKGAREMIDKCDDRQAVELGSAALDIDAPKDLEN